ncbi:hypothetical protein [Sphingomonas sp.]|uniref:hypothetical protein n=1 Tax=Sphingomonas sp. TaxID=28214 RepID=UPI002D7FEE07|nr:hypothetical protein [Sphingomonas sp.]HEU0045629.1 hypothetical protein [Sphingomonas sp.]
MSNYLGLLDLAIAGVPALAFGIWQLVSINREIARDKAKKASASPESPRHAVGEHGLNDR